MFKYRFIARFFTILKLVEKYYQSAIKSPDYPLFFIYIKIQLFYNKATKYG